MRNIKIPRCNKELPIFYSLVVLFNELIINILAKVLCFISL